MNSDRQLDSANKSGSECADVDVSGVHPGSGLDVGQCAELACVLEAAAAKPGNVHPGARFDDVTFDDFLASAAAIAPAMRDARRTGMGAAVLRAIEATRAEVGTNTSLGTVLLLAPLAAAPPEVPLAEGVADVLTQLTPNDARNVYRAIRLASAAGLGSVGEMDVADTPPDDLLAAMRLAAERDLVARQYAENYFHVIRWLVPWLEEGCRSGWPLDQTIVWAHVRLMSRIPDSLIARKCGLSVARESAIRAARVFVTGTHDQRKWNAALAHFDAWLRADRHRRNPGTTADLIAAALFVALRKRVITPPVPWSDTALLRNWVERGILAN
jgi:triphosphoribosyl-dephospho-CoA synthase